jgi:hypothetical protein
MRGLATILAAASCAVYASGCGKPGCGIGLPPDVTSDGGLRGFSNVPLGTSITVNVPIQDSADVDETVTGSSLTGSDAAAFKVLSTFPMSVPAGTSIMVSVQFTPAHVGASTANLILETAMMGPSPITLQGTATQ